MKKYLMLGVIISGSVILFSNCHTAKKSTTDTTSTTPKLSYATGVKSVVEANCTPCHFPSKGGNKKELDTYADLKTNIDEVIRRIELNPEEKGFMPFKHPKLNDSTIAAFKQWRDGGMPE